MGRSDTRRDLLLADVMAAADHFADELASIHHLSALERVELAQAIEDRAWAMLMSFEADKDRT